MRRFLLAAALLPSLFAQDAAQRSKLSDYPVHAQFPHFEIGADYLVHKIPAENRDYQADDYLVVEVAIFPADGEHPRVSSKDFTLRVNGTKVFDSASPRSVAFSLRYSDWSQRPALSADPDLGAAGVIPGTGPAIGRFPDDASGAGSPRTPQVRSGDDPYSVAPERSIPIEQAIANAALPEGLVQKPVKGDLFFGFRGKLKSIRSLELVYTGENGSQSALVIVETPQK